MKKKALFLLDESNAKKIYGTEDILRVKKWVDVYSPVLDIEQIKNNPEILKPCNIILSGWGGPCIDNWFLDKMPDLEAVFYGAGSIRSIVTPQFWEKNIIITSSWAANAVPVAEYTFAQIILCLKNAYKLNALYTKSFPSRAREIEDPQKAYKELHEKREAFGAYKSTIGIISLGMIGRLVCELLKNLDVKIIACDPYTNIEEAEALGVELVGLEEVFSKSHVISLHAPWLEETKNMITGKHFDLMMKGASFINTARGALVDEDEMIKALLKRQDLTAILDVTYPEPPDIDSKLYSMRNVFLTPHIAGSMNNECIRMGKYAVDELIRYLKGEPLKYQISEEKFQSMA